MLIVYINNKAYKDNNQIIRRLKKENERLKQLSNKANVSYDVIEEPQEEDNYDINQADRIKEEVITEKLANASLKPY